ncbi:GGDEF domain-containing protein [uncultured Brevundimonas sp.]|uniref:GGDEF domain-containing protein n=1 Tax=uncultured Brevundimonas sp. TaxID=213418 RepID=UPI0025F39957|nr:GGDEF domain-containing protein [uncultured Brevundimonas sp.]
MAVQVDLAIRGPAAYGLAQRVITEMESAGVWPTPLNFEIWLNAVHEPEGALATEIQRVLDAEGAISEADSERLAAKFLPRNKLSEQMRDAGAVLDRELSSVADVIAEAHRSQHAYGRTLAGASETISHTQDGQGLKTLVASLTSATEKAQAETAKLEQRLESSTEEIARLRENLDQVRREAMTDALTDLANRKAFDEQLARACAHADATGSPMTLALLDIDHFKRFNDTWGHQTGDQVLRYVASVLSRVCGETRFAARFGGEEFALIFPGEASGAVSCALEVIRKEIASRSLRRRSTNDDLGAVTISGGFAERQAGESLLALMERADAALYRSKRTGRNLISAAETRVRAA